MTEKRVLEFLNPKFNKGLNATIRNGLKWADAKPGEILNIRKTGSDVDIAVGRVLIAIGISIPNSEIELLPQEWLNYEHDENCRTHAGLREAMDRAYGVGKWGPEIVVLFFNV